MDNLAPLLIAGGGIGGLAAANAAARAGRTVRLLERAPAFAEMGAGVQLGPNASRILQRWGLGQLLQEVAAYPQRLVARNAASGDIVGSLPLGAAFAQRYGAPYVTIHRADLHALLHAAAVSRDVQMVLDAPVSGYVARPGGVALQVAGKAPLEGAALIGADGLHSVVRQQLLADGPPPLVGDCAWRSLLDPALLPRPARALQVTAWLGAGWHAVQYPVRGGAAMNLVVLLHGQRYVQAEDAGQGSQVVRRALRRSCAALRDLLAAVPHASLNAQAWRKWPLAARSPVTGAAQLARRRVALLGDAAHPMRPYLAQGAGMALEDAWALGQALASTGRGDVAAAFQQYASERWQRCARVQARSMQNGRIFRARGPLRLARDASLRLLGRRLMDVPWLYSHGLD